MRKKILVTGATGQQGGSLIAALQPVEENDDEYHILALTRSKSSPASQRLGNKKHVTLVEGDLNDCASIARIFQDAKHDGGEGESGQIWGVFMVLAFPGLGQNADAEEAQGKLLPDVALEYGVSAFIYSSALRSGPRHDDQLELSGRAKVRIERHIMGLTDRGLPWVIIRPGFFMENFSGTLGSLAVGLMQIGLKSSTCLDLVAADDIGRVVAAVFKDFNHYRSREMALISESLTADEIQQIYEPIAGRWSLLLARSAAWLVLCINVGTRNLIKTIDAMHDRFANGEYPERVAEMQIAMDACPQRTPFREWVARTDLRAAAQEGWNRVSVTGLVRGRS